MPYVPTKVDKELTDAILDNRFRLVILTRNAGDGKAAFIQKLEEAAVSRGSVRAGVTAHGSEFDNSGRHLTALYDGSIDIDGGNNTAVPDAFSKEFEGNQAPTALH